MNCDWRLLGMKVHYQLWMIMRSQSKQQLALRQQKTNTQDIYDSGNLTYHQTQGVGSLLENNEYENGSKEP